MENQYVIKATFNENIGGIAVDDKKKYSEKLKLTKQDFNKAIAPITIGAYYINKEISAMTQLSRNYVLNNRIESAKNVMGNISSTLGAFYFGGVSAGIGLVMAKTIDQIHQNVVNQTLAQQSEIATNNLREQIGLEATNYSRYRGIRR